MKRELYHFYDSMMELFYPNRCLVCDDVLPYKHERGCCQKCESTIDGDCLISSRHLCQKCGKPHAESQEAYCFDCKRDTHVFTQGRAVWQYSTTIKEAIKKFKFEEKPDLALSFAKEAAAYYNKYMNWSLDMIVPVPLHKEKLGERGYNQSHLVAQRLGLSLDIPVAPILVRKQKTLPQKELSMHRRRHNLENAMDVDDKWKQVVQGKRVLIVDDIYTTGATIDACASVLLGAGAVSVYFFALAIGEGF